MRDIFLRFASEAAWTALALEHDPGLMEIDVIGHPQHEVSPAEYGEGGAIVTLATFVTATKYLVNVRCMDDRDLSALAPFEVFPETPSRVWL